MMDLKVYYNVLLVAPKINNNYENNRETMWYDRFCVLVLASYGRMAAILCQYPSQNFLPHAALTLPHCPVLISLCNQMILVSRHPAQNLPQGAQNFRQVASACFEIGMNPQ